MLSLFPQILFLAPLAITLLRITVGIMLLLSALDHWGRRAELGSTPFMIIGAGAWIPLLATIIEGLTGVALILGYYTQAAAIVATLLALKHFVWHRRYRAFFPLPRSTSALLFVMSLALIFTGAGAFAFDLPL